MKSFICSLHRADDGQAGITVEADSPEQAAQEYVDGGDWGEQNKTSHVRVHVWPEGQPEAGEAYLVEIPPVRTDTRPA